MTRKKPVDSDVQINDKFGILERAVKLIAKYGIFRVIGGFMVVVLFILTIGLFLNQKKVTEDVIKEQTSIALEKHNSNMQLRLNEINPRIDAILLKLLIDSKADRVFVIEMHNGSNNPSGLPFIYGEITYEQIIDPKIGTIAEEYGIMNLSRYPFVNYVFSNKLFKGNLNDLSKIDSKLAGRMIQNDVKYLYMTAISGSNVDLGFLGVSYINNQPNKNAEAAIGYAAQKISIFLDLYNNSK